MTNKNINLNLQEPVYFQTTNEDKEKVKQLAKASEISISHNYVFPEGYDLEEMIAQAKEYMKQDNANVGMFYNRVHAERIIEKKDATAYLTKLEEVAVETREQLKAKQSPFTKYVIESFEFNRRTYGLDMSSIILQDHPKQEIAVASLIMVDNCESSNPKNITMSFLKPEELNCSLDRLEKFYNAIRETYTKILE